MKTSTSSKPLKKKVPQKRKIRLSDGTLIVTNDNKKKDIMTGKTTKHVLPKKKFSTETGMSENDYTVADDLDSSQYPPPSKHPLFRKFWSESIGNLTERSNFNISHLGLLESLCRIRVEIQHLDDFILQNGHTFRIVTVLGEQRKTYPEVNERNKALTLQAKYSQLLGLVPQKDKSKAKHKSEDEEWL